MAIRISAVLKHFATLLDKETIEIAGIRRSFDNASVDVDVGSLA
jgi:hypothetical protein